MSGHGHRGHFLTRWVFSLDHKVIGRQFLLLGLFFLLFGGFLSFGIRWQLAHPWQAVPVLGRFLMPASGGAFTPETYLMFVTLHGTIMIFFAITPILIGGFGNFLIPLQIGARDMAFPWLNMLSFWLYPPAAVLLVGSFFVEQGAAAAGWTGYPPLSSKLFSPGLGQTFWVLSLLLVGVSAIMGAINYITTTINLRARGMGLFRMPLTTWGLFLTAVLNLLYVPPIAIGLAMLLMDRTAGTHFFTVGNLALAGNGQPLLYQHLFWAFGHPEVYILILPVWGMVSDLLSVFSRKPAFGYRATVGSMCVISLLSGIVWAHHMFVAGISAPMAHVFQNLTMVISIPSAIFFLNWLATLWRGSLRLASTMLFALSVLWVFAIGGLTGIFLASRVIDIYFHDTYFVVAHFHYTLAASVLMGSFAAVHFWFPKMFGRKMDERLAKIHFALTFILINVVFLAMFRVGFGGMMRRLADPSVYDFLKHLAPWNAFISYAVFALGAAQLLFVANFFVSLWKGDLAEDNPWRAGSLEWTVPSPPPHGNFEQDPVVYRGPHEFSPPGAPEGKDFLLQTDQG